MRGDEPFSAFPPGRRHRPLWAGGRIPTSVIFRKRILIEFGNLIIYSLLNEDNLCLI